MKMICIAECTAIKKKTKARMFVNVEVGDTLTFATSLEAVGSNSKGGSYAVTIKCVNTRTQETVWFTFNELARILNCFEFEQK